MSDYRGLVLTNTIIKENDIIMNVLTDEGKIAIKAKGVLKPNSKNRSFTEIGCYSLFHTVDQLTQNVYTLKNAENIQRFSKIERDLTRKAIYNVLLEVFNKIEYTFDEAIQFVQLLNTCRNPYCLYAFFLCDIMKKSGICIMVDACVNCLDTSKIVGISVMDGGFVCADCFNPTVHVKLSVEELKNIRYCMHASLPNYHILEDNTDVHFELIQYFIAVLRNYGEISIRSHEFIEITNHLID